MRIVSTHLRPSRSGAKSSGLPPFVVPVCGILLLCSLGENFLLGCFATVTLLVGSLILWRPGEAPALLFVFAHQWLQAAIAVYYANLQGVGLAQLLSNYSRSAELATWLSIAGVAVLAIGLRIGAGRMNPAIGSHVKSLAAASSPRNWVAFFGAAWVISLVAQAFAWTIPGISQPLFALAQVKWAAFVVFTIAVFNHPAGNRALWSALFLVEIGLSIGGFFSSFKDVFFFAMIALAASSVRVTTKQAVGGTIMVVLLLALSVVWTAIKSEYREYASRGEVVQAVKIDASAQWSKIVDLVEALDANRLADAGETLVKRLSYVEFFGAALEAVPAYISHEWGALLWEAVSRPFMPRFFFPDKAVLDDSEMTRKYTGQMVSGTAEATSISIGYMGECYIDFGIAGMMLPVLMIGIVAGWVHRWLINSTRIGSLLGTGLSTIVLMAASRLETTLAKTVGGLLVLILLVWFLVHFVLPRTARGLGQVTS